ncbi:MAG: hypothetical protein GX451_09620 [Acholeplasmataceae bacterium]|jgi:hypothetical protein|nr:hypothetical protein [Acholeplasmataceae bacterium]
MMRKILASLFLVCIMMFGFASVSSAANWQWITSTDDTTVSFDTTSIIDKSIKISNTEYINCIYSVWIKFEFTDTEGDTMAQKYNFEKSVALQLVEMEFDYKNRGSRIKSSHIYAKDGSLLDSMPSYMVKTSFDSIIPGSGGEAIFQATFKEYKSQYGKK